MSLDTTRIESYTFIELSFLFTTVVICPVANKWLILLKSDKALPFIANLILIIVSNECLQPRREPAILIYYILVLIYQDNIVLFLLIRLAQNIPKYLN